MGKSAGSTWSYRSVVDAGLVAGRKCDNQGRHTCFFKAVNPLCESNVDHSYGSGQPRTVPDGMKWKWHEFIGLTVLVRFAVREKQMMTIAQDEGLACLLTVSDAIMLNDSADGLTKWSTRRTRSCTTRRSQSRKSLKRSHSGPTFARNFPGQSSDPTESNTLQSVSGGTAEFIAKLHIFNPDTKVFVGYRNHRAEPVSVLRRAPMNPSSDVFPRTPINRQGASFCRPDASLD